MTNGPVQYRLASISDLAALIEIGAALFDGPVKPERAKEFLDCPRHLLMLALRSEKIVGMASGFVYVHPDKDPVLFVDEVGVIDDFQRQGIGRNLVQELNKMAFAMHDCVESWVLTEDANTAANKAYEKAGGIKAKVPAVMYEFKKESPSV